MVRPVISLAAASGSRDPSGVDFNVRDVDAKTRDVDVRTHDVDAKG